MLGTGDKVLSVRAWSGITPVFAQEPVWYPSARILRKDKGAAQMAEWGNQWNLSGRQEILCFGSKKANKLENPK